MVSMRVFDKIPFWRLVAGLALGWLISHEAPADDPPPVDVPEAVATTAAEMKPYRELVLNSEATIDLLPIAGGNFMMGTADDDPEFEEDEGPQRMVEVSPFWMSKYEITWDSYDVWMSDLDVFRRRQENLTASPRELLAEAFQLSQPTKPYTDMTFGMGKRGFPAICMTQHAARTFCKWLSAKTGRFYRLPTEAEWEYACRAGTDTRYSFGDDASELENYAWFEANSEGAYHKVGKKQPNPWGLYDMHGNVAEWVLDQYTEDGYSPAEEGLTDPLVIPTTLYPRAVRGGSWDQFADECRSASRDGSDEEWIAQDPQNPVSIWYLTDALHVGFRIVRPLHPPSPEEDAMKWGRSEPVQKERPQADSGDH
jgi:formylglycine-generating enzyme required for sulfatase activity